MVISDWLWRNCLISDWLLGINGDELLVVVKQVI